MTVTYTEDLKPYPKTTLGDEPFTPSYARKTGGKKAVKTWMILAPIGLLVLGGSAAALLMNPATEPLAEPAPSLSVPAPAPTSAAVPAAPVETAPLVIEDAVIEPAPARTVRQAAPAARRAAPAAQPAPRIETLPQPAGPQPYTGSLNTATPAPAPTVATPAPTPPPPVVVIEPQG